MDKSNKAKNIFWFSIQQNKIKINLDRKIQIEKFDTFTLDTQKFGILKLQVYENARLLECDKISLTEMIT